ncbi:hypothetical protein AQPW35_08950 [Rubrivivax pictus]|uniref:DUF883 domain-containing protein n=2 Tax=Pseudaquabacterium pictum TaxID=2315236 RepID=A0A480AJK6_9BURK|nr:hypothetical protein AQPW35_08950 [Rubrivivax pictus]
MNQPLASILHTLKGNTMTELNTPASAANMIDRATQRSDAAIQAGTEAAHQALEGLSQSARQLQADAGHLSQRGLDALRDGTRDLRISARRAGERTVGYIHDEPVKSMLFAAAAGAAVMALLSLAGRSHR